MWGNWIGLPSSGMWPSHMSSLLPMLQDSVSAISSTLKMSKHNYSKWEVNEVWAQNILKRVGACDTHCVRNLMETLSKYRCLRQAGNLRLCSHYSLSYPLSFESNLYGNISRTKTEGTLHWRYFQSVRDGRIKTISLSPGCLQCWSQMSNAASR